jgi:hypothetical protein
MLAFGLALALASAFATNLGFLHEEGLSRPVL